MNDTLYQKIISNPQTAKYWGQTFLRDELITDILGSDTHSILYWAGKRMARKYPISNQQDLIIFFQQTGWGNLNLKHKNKNGSIWHLTSSLVKKRLQNNPDSDFMFEAGFIAQTIEQQLGVAAEAEMDPNNNKNGIVTINIHIDPKNNVPDAIDNNNNFQVINHQANNNSKHKNQIIKKNKHNK